MSYKRDPPSIGESVHISSIERLAQNAPVARSGRERLYLPRNLIENIPNLYSKYCPTETETIQWSPKSLSITTWSGEIATPDCSDKDMKEVQNALKDACRRLKELGYDVLDPSWNSHALLKKA